MNLQAALIKEQGVTFAVVAVKPAAAAPGTRHSTASSAARLFPGCPVVLMSQDHTGRATFYGRSDLVRFLSRVSLHSLPWRRFNAA